MVNAKTFTLTKTIAVGLTAFLLVGKDADAHTNSIGYVGEGGGSVVFWYGTWHRGTNFNEGSLRLQGATGTSFGPVTTAFNIISPGDNSGLVFPTGLIPGTNFFRSNGSALVAYTNGSYAFQGVRFTGLSAGRYIFTYVPIATPTATWDPADSVILSSEVELTAEILAGGGPSAEATLFALQANSGAVRGLLNQRTAATTFALGYDCSVFDQYGACVTIGARNTQLGSSNADSGETAGLLIAAYRMTDEFRIGGFIDHSLVSQTPTGIETKNTQPMVGAFAVYQENADFSGLTIRAALAYQEGELRITRPELEGAEPGTGRSRTTALAFGGEIAYGFPIDDTWVAQPYAGLRRSDSQRHGYSETTSDSVQFPISYNRFGQTVTSATAGLRLRGAITPEFSLTFGAGMERDLDSKMDRYAGTSGVSGLETFSINASQQQNETRAVGSAGMRYMVASNQAIGFDASVRQMPYGNDPSITTMLRYSIGF